VTVSTPQTRVLVTADGVRLQATLQRRDGARGTVVIVHGISASMEHAAVRAVADEVLAAGYDVLTYDGRGHGGSEGLCTLGDLESLDVAAAVAAARADATSPIALVGASMGAIAVLRHAVDDPDLAVVVTVSSPSVWRVPRTMLGLLSVTMTRTSVGRRVAAARLGVRLHPDWTAPEPPVSLARRIPVPLAVVHGRRDRFVSPACARELFAATPGRRRLDLVAGMGHAYDSRAIPAIVAGLDWGFRVARA
jgi:pimeloyl-ACP methyl ester carboxylesterase